MLNFGTVLSYLPVGQRPMVQYKHVKRLPENAQERLYERCHTVHIYFMKFTVTSYHGYLWIQASSDLIH